MLMQELPQRLPFLQLGPAPAAPVVAEADLPAADVIWSPRRDLDGLPSVFLKAAKAGLANLL